MDRAERCGDVVNNEVGMTQILSDPEVQDEKFGFQAPEDGAEPEEHISPVDKAEEDRLTNAAERIRLLYKGIRVCISGLPSQRKVSDSQKKQAASLFGAKAGSVSMSTLLWDADEPRVKDVRAICAAIGRTWHARDRTLPTTVDGLRKIKKDCVAEVHGQLQVLQESLAAVAESLEREMPAIMQRERGRRGELFRASDYEEFRPTKDIAVSWSFPVVTEDSELAELDDSVYQHELQRIRAEGMASVEKFEAQLAEGMVDMLDAVVERLEGGGKRKTFKDSTPLKIFEELQLYGDQLKELGVGGKHIEKAMKRLSLVVKGHDRGTFPDALRKGSDEFRTHVCEKLGMVRDVLVSKAVPVQRRSVLRKRMGERRKS